MKQWRWTLSDSDVSDVQESGQRPNLRDAMNDVASTVEYVLSFRKGAKNTQANFHPY